VIVEHPEQFLNQVLVEVGVVTTDSAGRPAEACHAGWRP